MAAPRIRPDRLREPEFQHLHRQGQQRQVGPDEADGRRTRGLQARCSPDPDYGKAAESGRPGPGNRGAKGGPLRGHAGVEQGRCGQRGCAETADLGNRHDPGPRPVQPGTHAVCAPVQVSHVHKRAAGHPVDGRWNLATYARRSPCLPVHRQP